MLTRELLRRIRKIEIVTERLVRDRMAGQYHSVFKGRGIAFEEVRPYIPGDDIRFIDWNVTARMNEAYVKLFSEEREMTVCCWSTCRRRKLARDQGALAELAAVAFSAIKNNGRVELIIFTDDVERFVRKKGKKHVLRVVSEILSFAPEPAPTSKPGCNFWAHRPPAGSRLPGCRTSWPRRRRTSRRASPPPARSDPDRSPIRWKNPADVGFLDLDRDRRGGDVRHQRPEAAFAATRGLGAHHAVPPPDMDGQCAHRRPTCRRSAFFEARARRLRR
jgi:uncharacterized protein (DUF58 family)